MIWRKQFITWISAKNIFHGTLLYNLSSVINDQLPKISKHFINHLISKAIKYTQKFYFSDWENKEKWFQTRPINDPSRHMTYAVSSLQCSSKMYKVMKQRKCSYRRLRDFKSPKNQVISITTTKCQRVLSKVWKYGLCKNPNQERAWLWKII